MLQIIDQPTQAPTRTRRNGFLPIKTNAFDRVFIAVITWIALHLLWMRFVEAVAPLWIASVIALVIGIVIIWRG